MFSLNLSVRSLCLRQTWSIHHDAWPTTYRARKWFSFPVHFERYVTRLYATVPHLIFRNRIQSQNYCNMQRIISQ